MEPARIVDLALQPTERAHAPVVVITIPHVAENASDSIVNVIVRA